MRSKIKRILSFYSGYDWWKLRHLENGLYCFNYHRIGHADATQFDSNVFSCTVERFEEHVEYYKKSFRVVNLEELSAYLNDDRPIDEKLALITFDDGYIDNYQLAFPVLKKHDVSAVFFLPTDFIGTEKLTWWDETAWYIRNTKADRVQLSFMQEPVIINTRNYSLAIRDVLKALKQDRSIRIEDKIAELRRALSPDGDDMKLRERLFLNWAEAAEMLDAGMDIGSHSNSHELLSHLTREEQRYQIQQSIKKLEENLKAEVSAFAYPVGGADSYTQETVELLKEVDIKLAFTFIEGVNLDLRKNPYELRRLSVHGDPGVSTLQRIVLSV